jgi:6-phosphogluconolactonase
MMQSIRRKFLTRCGLSLALAGLALAGGHAGAAAAQTELVYVGTQAGQIHALRFDTSSGKLATIGPVAEGPKSTWTLAHPQLPILYAVNDDKDKDGSVIAYAVNRETGALTKVNEAPTGGPGTTHLSLDLPSMTLFAANFGGGSASTIAIKPDGSLGPLVSTIKATGSGPHRRQTSPHAHGSAVDPSGKYALVPDLGADRVFVYGFDRATHALTPDDAAKPRSFVAPPGSGPRRTVFSADGRFVYVLNELTAELMVLRWDAQQARLATLQTAPLSSAEFKGNKSGSEIALSRDGRFIYAGNRGENALVVYGVNAESGELSPVQSIGAGGETPWGFALHPSGKWLVVANQKSGTVNVFSVDTASGKLADTGQSVAAPTPVSITFVK